MASGAVFTWGQWSNGRLGLGEAPTLDKRSAAAGELPRSGGGKSRAAAQSQGRRKGWQKRSRVQRYQLSPRWLPSLGRVAVLDAACGDGHVVAVTAAGELYSWGKNTSGQLGDGSIKDKMFPTKLTRFLGAEPTPATLHFLEKKDAPVFVKVVCGAFHSAALDSKGLLFTWGGSGSSTLGHGDAGGGRENASSVVHVPASALKRANTTGTASGRGGGAAAAAKFAAAQSALQGNGVESNEHVYLVHTQPWRWPRALYYFARNQIALSEVSAGVQHMVVVSTGQASAFVWGDPNDRNELRLARVHEKQRQSSGSTEAAQSIHSPTPFPSEPTLLLQNHNADLAWGYGGGSRRETQGGNTVVDAPTEDACVDHVACGGWQVLVSSSGSRLGRELLDGYQRVQKQTPPTSLMVNNDNDAEHWMGQKSQSERHGAADVRIVVGKRVIRAHAVVVAARCPVLAERMDLAKLSVLSPHEAVQVMMPDVSVKVASLMIEFMYGDNVTTRLDPASPLGVALGTAAADYGMSALATLCRQAVMDPSLIDDRVGQGDDRVNDNDDDAEEGDAIVLVPRTLKHDMGFFVNNDKWADVQIIAESGDDRRILHAHEFILQSRCEKLKLALRPLVAKPDDVSRQLVKRLYVPETRSCFLDLLWYLYTGSLAHIATAHRMTSLWVAAHRYGLWDLQLRCEASIRPTVANCCRLLQMSALMPSSTLTAPAVAFAAKHLAALECTRAFSLLWRLHPDVVAEIVKTRQGWANSEHSLGMAAWATDDATGKAGDEEEMVQGQQDVVQDDQGDGDDKDGAGTLGRVSFPWAVALVLTLIFGGSMLISSLDPALLRYVPIANGAMLVGCVIYCANYLSGA